MKKEGEERRERVSAESQRRAATLRVEREPSTIPSPRVNPAVLLYRPPEALAPALRPPWPPRASVRGAEGRRGEKVGGEAEVEGELLGFVARRADGRRGCAVVETSRNAASPVDEENRRVRRGGGRLGAGGSVAARAGPPRSPAPLAVNAPLGLHSR